MKRGTSDLSRIAEHMQINERGDHEYYLDKETGQVLVLPRRVLWPVAVANSGNGGARAGRPMVPEWARPFLPIARSIVSGELRYVQVPYLSSRFPYRTIIEFADSLPEPDRDGLLRQLQGKGTFKRFKHFLKTRPEYEGQWKKFREGRLYSVVEDWLQCIGVECEPNGDEE